jgi:FkbM family methyltransferase
VLLLTKLKAKYITYCQFSTAVDRVSALRLAFWDGSHDICVRPKHASADVLIRGNSSDVDVFGQIFIQQEYGSLLGAKNVDLVIDAGANVGYSSVYFLTHFPNCHVIAIEPDPANFVALTQNLAPYQSRVRLYNCGIWSKPAQLAIETSLYRDGREWTRQVRECAAGEKGDITAITIGELLRQSGRERLSLLKMDIEGAEIVVFSHPEHQQWLPLTDAMAIELHDDTSFGKATELFHAVVRDQDFQISHNGELTICQRG